MSRLSPSFTKMRLPDPLPRQEEEELAIAYKEGDKAAGDKILLHNYRGVIWIAQRFFYPGMSYEDQEDLVSAGFMGMHRALKKFEPDRGFKFMTYAYWWVEQFIRRYHQDVRGDVRIPVYTQEVLNAYGNPNAPEESKAAAQEKLRTAMKAFGLSSEDETYHFLKRALSKGKGLDAPLGDDPDSSCVRDMTPQFAIPSPEKMAFMRDAWEKIEALIDEVLTEKEAFIIRKRYLDADHLTLEATSSFYGVTRERIRQIELGALKKLRRAASTRDLHDARLALQDGFVLRHYLNNTHPPTDHRENPMTETADTLIIEPRAEYADTQLTHEKMTQQQIETIIDSLVAQNPEIIENEDHLAEAAMGRLGVGKTHLSSADIRDLSTKRAKHIRSIWEEPGKSKANTHELKKTFLEKWILKRYEEGMGPPSIPTIRARMKSLFGSSLESGEVTEMRNEIAEKLQIPVKPKGGRKPKNKKAAAKKRGRTEIVRNSTPHVMIECVEALDTEKSKLMLAAWEANEAAGIPVPVEILDYFGGTEKPADSENLKVVIDTVNITVRKSAQTVELPPRTTHIVLKVR